MRLETALLILCAVLRLLLHYMTLISHRHPWSVALGMWYAKSSCDATFSVPPNPNSFLEQQQQKLYSRGPSSWSLQAGDRWVPES